MVRFTCDRDFYGDRRTGSVACASGYRSSIAASTLAAHGFSDVSDLLGGYDAWAKAGQPVETPTGS